MAKDLLTLLQLTDIAHAMKVWKNLLGKGDKIHANEIAVAPGLLLGDALGDSGTNANGSWLKLPDGTMMCWINFTITTKTNIAYGGFYYAPEIIIPLPQTFYDNPNHIIFARTSGGSDVFVSGNSEVVRKDRLERIYIYTISQVTTNKIYYLFAQVIGRWKA